METSDICAMKTLRTSLAFIALLTVLTGILYPLLITGIAHIAFPSRANGSLVTNEGRVVGSALIGQSFSRSDYFWGRPSATQPSGYTGTASSGSNLGPLNPALIDSVRQRALRIWAMDSATAALVPVDLVTSSASGLDPHVSVASALLQVSRIARTRGIAEDEVRTLVQRHIEGRQWGVLGEPRVNVLLLNLSLDQFTNQRSAR
jgi:potassium-transporting ATPase KdpC subunit